jgi:hypothetical protein
MSCRDYLMIKIAMTTMTFVMVVIASRSNEFGLLNYFAEVFLRTPCNNGRDVCATTLSR